MDVFSEGTRQVLAAMKGAPGIKLLAVTGIGAGDSKGHGGFFYDRIINPLLLATIYEDENRQEALIQLLCDRAFEWSLNAGETIERVIARDSPSWSPRFVDQLVGDRIHRELMDFTDKVRRNPNHELRQSATRFLFEFADDLQNDDATIARAETVKEQLMARDEVTRAAESAWPTIPAATSSSPAALRL